ncbi:MAG: Holliday junction resolvase RuvX [Chlamydiia bacterium]|nr:Holliday junction resolvase RuvX [Chlamydiia bacterium]
MSAARTRIVGIDYGLARIGVSLSDEMKIIASPFRTVQAERKLVDTALRVKECIDAIEQEKGCTVSEVVVGMPLRMNGSVGAQADEVQAFIDELKKLLACPVTAWDERLTTVQAEKALREANLSRKKRSKVVDNVAATIILQSYLEFRSPLP